MGFIVTIASRRPTRRRLLFQAYTCPICIAWRYQQRPIAERAWFECTIAQCKVASSGVNVADGEYYLIQSRALLSNRLCLSTGSHRSDQVDFKPT